MDNNNSESGLMCLWGNLKDHPKCLHGPTLLFGRSIKGELKKFHACSHLREPGKCPTIKNKKNNVLPFYDHRKLFLRFSNLLSNSPNNRNYCHNCNELFSSSEIVKHKDHDVQKCLTNHQMSHPTEFLKPLSNNKEEAQYFFTENTTKNITEILCKLGAKYILCIGVPRLYEYISYNFGDKMTCFLLDIDARFHQFVGPLNYAWYNLFNNHFFNPEAKTLFKDFLTQENGRDMYIVCDPPFGGRVEPISQTIKSITDNHKKWNNIKVADDELKTLFIFPYFMESIIKKKSNPPGIAGGISDLDMTDFKVEYQNHATFQEQLNLAKKPSPVRLFTNIKLSLINLENMIGYKYCSICSRWVLKENNHCDKCGKCTSKDGREFTHCDLCERCVKHTWEHCETCQRCASKIHDCSQRPKIVENSLQCHTKGLIDKDCSESETFISRKRIVDRHGGVVKKRRKKKKD